MPKYELSKLIEARKLNRRNMLPLAEPPVTIPFGAVIEEVRFVGNDGQFKYLTDYYQCAEDLLRSAMVAVGGVDAPESPGLAGPDAGAVAVSALEAEAASPAGASLKWEALTSGAIALHRSKVPGGWLIAAGRPQSSCVCFYPDPDHLWDGSSLE